MTGPIHQTKPNKQTYQKQKKRPQMINDEPPSNWALLKGLLFGKHLQSQHQQVQQKKQQQQQQTEHVVVDEPGKKCKKMRCSGSLCSNTKIIQRPETASPEFGKKRVSSLGSRKPLHQLSGVISSTTNGGSFRGLPFTRFSGCYECRMVIDPVLGIGRDPSLRTTICSCPECGEIFMKAENLELHQAVRHAVSELGPEDTSKNIVEIIFQSSWLKKQTPVCQIDRILKVQNTPRTISKFEEYRESIKSKATKFPKKQPRCLADGNELLRFYCTTFACSLGLNGSSNLCNSNTNCNVCSIIKNGFKVSREVGNGGSNGKGILTTATSGKAHDMAARVEDGNQEKRAMLVCRVIAGRVKKNMEGSMEDYDSVTVGGGEVGVYSNMDELYVFNPKSILPCFVVIYRGF